MPFFTFLDVFGKCGKKFLGLVNKGNVEKRVLVYVLVLDHINFNTFIYG